MTKNDKSRESTAKIRVIRSFLFLPPMNANQRKSVEIIP